MSSSDTQRELRIGARVEATDGHCGRLVRVIIDPVAQAIAYLGVEPGRHERRTKLVPIDLVDSIEEELIRLSATKEQFDQLDSAEEIQFLPPETAALGYGESSAMLPYYSLRGTFDVPGRHSGEIFSDRVPLGDVEIRRGDPVHATDGWIGEVAGLVIDPADHHVTHVLLKEGHPWGHKQVAIPIGTAARVADEVRVALSKGEVEALPDVSLRAPA